MPICSQCGTPVSENAKFCPVCGAAMAAAPVPEAPQAPQQPPVAQQPQQGYPPQDPGSYPPGPSQQNPQPPYPQAPGYQPYSQNPNYQQPYQGYAPYQPEPPAPAGPTIGGVWGRAMEVLKSKPIRLWGVSLMYTLLSGLAVGLGVLPIIYLPITFVLEAGMKAVYLAGLKGKEVQTDHLFTGFRDGKFFRFAGGMGWMYLWVFIWALIPIVGIVLAIIKALAYSFTPYIMMEDPEITGPEALRKSMQMTDGLKGKMFGGIVLPVIIVSVASLILGALSTIRYVGILFAIVEVVFLILVAVLMPLFLGLVEAAFYDEKNK